jgi:hypothetical protein
MKTTPEVSARIAGLKAARAKDSQDKRARVLSAVKTLEAAGTAVTFAAVAETAGVSTWLVYSPGVREHIDAARRRQSERPGQPDIVRSLQCATPSSLRTELAVARDQIGQLRAERDKLQSRLRLQLGAEIDGPDRPQLIARVAELETVNRQLVVERDARRAEAEAVRQQVRELENDLTAARESLRRVIRSENRVRTT